MASVWGELKRRNVVKVVVAYAIVGWLLIEVASTVFPIVQLPDWTVTFLTMLILFGFPIALILSWAYEITPEGMKRSHEVEATESISHVTGRKLDFAIIGALVLALGFVVYNYVLDQPPGASAGSVDRRSIAVLPFSNESAAEENAEFFANGIHDNLLTQLARISALKVISRTSVIEYRDTTKNMRQIGRELGVATILEGGVQRAGNSLQINVQLIDVETDEHLWAEVYDRELTAENIFAIQREMATSIAEALQATLSPQEVDQLSRVPTQNTRAWDFFLSGADYERRREYRLALQQYERAVAEDSEFALAWTAVSRRHSYDYFWGIDRTEARLAQALEAVERAFEQSPDLPQAHLAMGDYYWQGFRDFDSSLEEYTIAELGMPGDADLYGALANLYRRVGEWDESLANYERAIELDPRNINHRLELARTYSPLRDYQQAEQAVERALEIAPGDAALYGDTLRIPAFRDGDYSLFKAAIENPPIALPKDWDALAVWEGALYDRDYAAALSLLDDAEFDVYTAMPWRYVPIASLYGVTYHLAGERELAEQQFQAAREQLEAEFEATSKDPRFLNALGRVLAGLGENEEAVRMARQAIDVTSRDTYARPNYQLDAIFVFVMAGDSDAATEELDAYLGAPGSWSIEGLLPDPRLDPIRDDPRFQSLVEKYRRQ